MPAPKPAAVKVVKIESKPVVAVAVAGKGAAVISVPTITKGRKLLGGKGATIAVAKTGAAVVVTKAEAPAPKPETKPAELPQSSAPSEAPQSSAPGPVPETPASAPGPKPEPAAKGVVIAVAKVEPVKVVLKPIVISIPGKGKTITLPFLFGKKGL